MGVRYKNCRTRPQRFLRFARVENAVVVCPTESFAVVWRVRKLPVKIILSKNGCARNFFVRGVVEEALCWFCVRLAN